MSALRFSIVLPCLTDSATLARCLESISEQEFPVDRFEVLVVDDFSDPPLAPAVEALGSDRFQSIALKCIRNSENLGRSRTRNRGIAESVGEIILFMDVDQVVDSGFLRAMDGAFGSARLKSVRANTSVWPPLLEKSAYLRYYDSRFLGKRSPEELATINLEDLPAKYFASGCIAVTRAALDITGGFDGEFRHYGCEDEELGNRLQEAGVPLSVCLEARVYNIADDLNIRRVCKRFVEYAQQSVPILLRKHPAYARHTLMWFLELPGSQLNAKYRIVRTAMLGLFRPWLARLLVDFLEKRDGRPGFNPPGSFYQLAIAGFYLQGYRLRNRKLAA